MNISYFHWREFKRSIFDVIVLLQAHDNQYWTIIIKFIKIISHIFVTIYG